MARSDKYNKNLSRVQSMLDGTYQDKIQVGAIVNNPHANRKVGERWKDSDGVEWEQKEGYRSKVTKINVGIFSKVCKDCEKPCTDKLDKDTWTRMERCYYCQIDFEAMLKTRRIGVHGNKWQFWVRLLELQRWISGREDLEAWIEDRDKLMNQKVYDESVANALANANVSMEIKKNT